jgi:hypothetical protein
MQKDSSLKEGAKLTIFKVKNITLASLSEGGVFATRQRLREYNR